MKRVRNTKKYKTMLEGFKSEDYALELFSSESFLTVNKKLLKTFGPETTIYLSLLIDKFKYFSRKEALKEGVFFYMQNEKASKQTGMSVFKVVACKSKLVKEGVLIVRKFGLPSKDWLVIDFTKLLGCIHLTSRDKETASLEIKKLNLSINSINTNNTNNKPRLKNNKENFFLEMFPLSWQQDENFQEALDGYIQDRKERKNPVTERSAKLASNKLMSYDLTISIETLLAAVERGWSGLFPESIAKGKSLDKSIFRKGEVDAYEERELDPKFRTRELREEDL